MHPSSLDNMKICVDKYAGSLTTPGNRKAIVVDIGAMDINGSYRQLFDTDRFHYIGVDMEAGNGVDVVLDDPYQFPFEDNYADLVISGQMLEHNKFFWLTFAEKVRILNDTGYCFMLTPSRGPIHRFPMDYYRFYPDSYQALAEYTDSALIDCWLDTEAGWGDLVGVWQKSLRPGVTPFDTTTLTQIANPRTTYRHRLGQLLRR